MFRGRFEHTIDAKGRLNVPARVREVLHDRYSLALMVTNGFDGCLDCYPLSEWAVLEETASRLPQHNKEVKSYQRFYLSAAIECPLDGQGRILLPPSLRSYAELEKDVVVVCTGKKIELWSRERWGAELGDIKGSGSEICAAIAALEQLHR
ncbi:MAG: division/cell wall cluster transcriptional repressor MraZ [Deltaproteobacteria bacterium]|nr:division/cell wall cluster transcriptional repressor MraZ [Candidatus Anaeroferrophillacea bacterium]